MEQQILRYELGEIAHIENVLKSETRSRTFKTSTTTAETETVERETTEDKEQDLSSSERFELKSESQTVIGENASKDGGLTIHASYGPSVDATSNFNFSSSNSRQESDTASSSYAREIATKAINRGRHGRSPAGRRALCTWSRSATGTPSTTRPATATSWGSIASSTRSTRRRS